LPILPELELELVLLDPEELPPEYEEPEFLLGVE
jgi:hypothetical protein